MQQVVRYALVSVWCLSCSLPKPETVRQDGPTQLSVDSSALKQNVPEALPDFYAGFVHQHPQPAEFFVQLPSLPGVSIAGPELADSATVYDTETSTTNIPNRIVRNFFKVEGLDTVVVLTESNDVVARCPLLRFERIDRDMARFFAAVYKAPPGMNKVPLGTFYALGNEAAKLIRKGFMIREIHDPAHDRLVESILPARVDKWTMTHKQLLPFEAIYSIVNIREDGPPSPDNLPYIVEVNRGVGSIIFSWKGQYFNRLIPIPILVNLKPILVVSYSGFEGSDVSDILLYFDGTSYKVRP